MTYRACARRLRRWMPLLTLPILLLLLWRTGFQYATTDDTLLVDLFMNYGALGGTLPTTNRLHPLLTWIVGLLSRCFPDTAMFSIVHLLLLWCGLSALFTALLRCCRSWSSAVLTVLTAGVCVILYCVRPTFSVTASLLGAAAIATLMSIEAAEHKAATLSLSLALLTLSYLLRTDSFPATLAFYGLAALCGVGQRKLIKREPTVDRRLILPLAGFALICIALIAWQWLCHAQNEAFFSFHAARVELMDYHRSLLSTLSPETLSALGWSEEEATLVNQWYLLDTNISQQALETILATADGASPSLAGVAATIFTFARQEPYFIAAFAVMLLLSVLCFFEGRKRGIAALLTLLLSLTLLTYLAYRGRLIDRAADCVVLPAGIMLLCFALPDLQGKRSPLRCCLILLLILALGGQALCAQQRYTPAIWNTVAANNRLEQFAREHPDTAIIRTSRSRSDKRMFHENGAAPNLLLPGDWCARCDAWYEQYSAAGLDGRTFTAEDYLQPHVLFCSIRKGEPETIARYITSRVGYAVEPELYAAEGILSFYRFVRSDTD